MKNWKAAVTQWNARQKDKPKDKFHNFHERSYDYDELERRLLTK